MNECEHNWIYQNTSKKCSTSGYENYYANFSRIDRYYCSKCCEIKELTKNESVSLPFGGIRHPEAFAPTWYK